MRLIVGDLNSFSALRSVLGTRERKRIVSSAKTELRGEGLLPSLEAVIIFCHKPVYSPSSIVMEKASATSCKG